ncbi:MAG: hypothetical protein RLZZ188_3243 [Verrucomicrobiota bacterium]
MWLRLQPRKIQKVPSEEGRSRMRGVKSPRLQAQPHGWRVGARRFSAESMVAGPARRSRCGCGRRRG